MNTPVLATTSALPSDTSGVAASSSGDASINEIDNLDVVNPQSGVTVQAKLKETRERGTKLDYESLVVQLKNHPWEESHEQLENEYRIYSYTD